MLEIRNVDAYYGRAQVLRRVSMQVPEKEIVTLLGGNGTGKSTTLKAVCGVVTPRAGEIVFKDRKIHGSSTDVVFKQGIVYIPQDRVLFAGMTVLDNLELGAIIRKHPGGIEQGLERVFHYFPRLKERLSQKAKTLSGGEQSMLAIGRALMSNPDLLMMDEPSAGLAPQLVAEMAKLIRRMNADGLTILLVEQNVRMALSLSKQSFIIRGGEIVYSGESSRLFIKEIYQAYFG